MEYTSKNFVHENILQFFHCNFLGVRTNKAGELVDFVEIL